MKISVRARTNQKTEEVIPPQPMLMLMQEGEEWYVVKTKEKPIHGRANDAITRILADALPGAAHCGESCRGGAFQQENL